MLSLRWRVFLLLPLELSRLGLGVLTGTSSWLVLSRSCRYKSKFRPVFFLGGWAGANLRQLRELRHLSRTYITLALNDPKKLTRNA